MTCIYLYNTYIHHIKDPSPDAYPGKMEHHKNKWIVWVTVFDMYTYVVCIYIYNGCIPIYIYVCICN